MTVIFKAGSRPSVVFIWLLEHPGYHTPAHVALSTGLTTHQAATVLRELMVRGLVTRKDKQYTASASPRKAHDDDE